MCVGFLIKYYHHNLRRGQNKPRLQPAQRDPFVQYFDIIRLLKFFQFFEPAKLFAHLLHGGSALIGATM